VTGEIRKIIAKKHVMIGLKKLNIIAEAKATMRYVNNDFFDV